MDTQKMILEGLRVQIDTVGNIDAYILDSGRWGVSFVPTAVSSEMWQLHGLHTRIRYDLSCEHIEDANVVLTYNNPSSCCVYGLYKNESVNTPFAIMLCFEELDHYFGCVPEKLYFKEVEDV